MDDTRRNLLKVFGISALVSPPALIAAIKPLTDIQPLYLGDIDEGLALTYRATGAWGEGKLKPLTAEEIDGNFWTLHTRLSRIEQLLRGKGGQT